MSATRPSPTSGLALAAALAAAAALAGCGSASTGSDAPDTSGGSSAASTYPVETTDCGEPLTIEEKPAEVLTVGTAAISMMDAAGASGSITARSGEFGADLPADLQAPPTAATIIDPSDPSTEAVIGADVDTVYGYGFFNAKPSQLTDAGITLLTVAPFCGEVAGTDAGAVGLADVSAEVRRLGTVFDTRDTADAAAASLDAEAEAATRDAGSAGSAAWLYYFSSEDSLSAYGAGGIAQDLLTRAGMDNAYGDQAKAFTDISTESLIQADPAWIVMTYGLYGESEEQARAKLLSEPGAADLAAVRSGRLVMIPSALSEASPQSVQALQRLNQAVGA